MRAFWPKYVLWRLINDLNFLKTQIVLILNEADGGRMVVFAVCTALAKLSVTAKIQIQRDGGFGGPQA